MVEDDVVIIGGGLTGLTLKYLFQKVDISATILEARDRLGGRILTSIHETTAPIELGATWLGNQHQDLIALLKELQLEIYPQELGAKAIYEPISTSPPMLVQLGANNNPTFRIRGGTKQLIDALINLCSKKEIYLNEKVSKISLETDQLIINTSSKTIKTKYIISTLPPFLLNKTIEILPALPDDIRTVLASTHTWMGESIKIALSYHKPFWRNPKMSGTLASNVGPISELYDHSNYDDDRYALMGFLNGAYFNQTREERKAIVLNQLRKYYGPEIDNYLQYHELVWRREDCTFSEYDSPITPHQNNGHPLFSKAYFNERLFIAGAETAKTTPGYMNGAISSAQFVFDKLYKKLL